MKRCLLAHLLESTEVGQEFSAWPLHVTQVPWFETSVAPEEVMARIVPALIGLTAVTVSAVKHAGFGPNCDIPVYLLSGDEQLRELQFKLLAGIDEAGFAIEDRRFVGENTTLHITDKDQERVKIGDEFTVKSLSLVENTQDEVTKLKKIIDSIELPKSRGNLIKFFDFETVQLESASSTDIPVLVEIINEAFSYQDAHKTEKRTDLDHLTRRIVETDFYVARQDGEIVGCVYVNAEDEALHFGMLSVIKRMQGKRLAPTLIAAIEALAKSEGYKILALHYMSVAPWLKQYYEKHGFEETGEVINWGEIDIVRMEKKLP